MNTKLYVHFISVKPGRGAGGRARSGGIGEGGRGPEQKRLGLFRPISHGRTSYGSRAFAPTSLLPGRPCLFSMASLPDLNSRARLSFDFSVKRFSGV